MKKTAFILIVSFALLANAGVAQDLRSLTFGPKVGLNLSNVYDTEGENFVADSKIGLAGGLFVSLPLGSLFGVQPELLFSQKGFKATGSILGNSYSFTRTLNYIDLPLLIAVKPAPSFTLLVGPQFAFLMSRKDVFTNSALTIDQEEQFNNENLRKNTLGVVAGFDLNLNRIVVGVRAGYDLSQNNGDGTSTTPRYKNAWYQATLGFRL